MRLIDADEFFKDFCELEPYEHISHEYDIDAVEVVRCKDCKFNYANQIPSDDACQRCVELPISKDFFCAYGEKMEGVYE